MSVASRMKCTDKREKKIKIKCHENALGCSAAPGVTGCAGQRAHAEWRASAAALALRLFHPIHLRTCRAGLHFLVAASSFLPGSAFLHWAAGVVFWAWSLGPPCAEAVDLEPAVGFEVELEG